MTDFGSKAKLFHKWSGLPLIQRRPHYEFGSQLVVEAIAQSLALNPNGEISGTVKASGTPVVNAEVRLYNRRTGAFCGRTRTDSNGKFVFAADRPPNEFPSTLMPNEQYYAIALDPEGGTNYNAVILDKLTPVENFNFSAVIQGPWMQVGPANSFGDYLYPLGPDWLSGWNYRKLLLLNSGGSKTDYQIKIKVGESSGASGYDIHCENKCLNNFADIRFAKADGTTLRPYFIETITGTTPNQTASVWVKIQTLDQGENVFLYYGNANATDAANGVDTFVLFDHFEGSSLDANKWSSNGSPSVANSIVTTLGNDNNNRWYSVTPFNPGAGYGAGMCCKFTSGYGRGGWQENTANLLNSGDTSDHAAFQSDGGSGFYGEWSNALQSSSDVGASDTANWHIVELLVSPTIGKVLLNANVLQTVTTVTYLPDANMKLKGSSILQCHWAYVRKWANNDASIKYSGPEQQRYSFSVNAGANYEFTP